MSIRSVSVKGVIIVVVVAMLLGCNLFGGDRRPDDLVHVNSDQDWFVDNGFADIWTIDNDARTATASISDHQDWMWAVMRDQFSNFDLSFEFSKTSGSLSDVVSVYAHVMNWERTGNSENEYFINFGLENGSFLIAYVDASNTWHYVTDPTGNGWVASSDMKTGLDVWNRVRIVRFGTSFHLYINDVKQGEFVDESRTDGYLALGGGYWSSYDGATTIQFRDWSCTAIDSLPSDM